MAVTFPSQPRRPLHLTRRQLTKPVCNTLPPVLQPPKRCAEAPLNPPSCCTFSYPHLGEGRAPARLTTPNLSVLCDLHRTARNIPRFSPATQSHTAEVRETPGSTSLHIGDEKKYIFSVAGEGQKRLGSCSPCLPDQHFIIFKVSVTLKIRVAGHSYGPTYPGNNQKLLFQILKDN